MTYIVLAILAIDAAILLHAFYVEWQVNKGEWR